MTKYLCLLFMLCATSVHAAQITFVFSHPRADEVVEYRLYRSATPEGERTFVVASPDARETIEATEDAYYVATVVDANGNESGESNQVFGDVVEPLEPPTIEIEMIINVRVP